MTEGLYPSRALCLAMHMLRTFVLLVVFQLLFRYSALIMYHSYSRRPSFPHLLILRSSPSAFSRPLLNPFLQAVLLYSVHHNQENCAAVFLSPGALGKGVFVGVAPDGEKNVISSGAEPKNHQYTVLCVYVCAPYI